MTPLEIAIEALEEICNAEPYDSKGHSAAKALIQIRRELALLGEKEKQNA